MSHSRRDNGSRELKGLGKENERQQRASLGRPAALVPDQTEKLSEEMGAPLTNNTPRDAVAQPIPEIFEAARLLQLAVAAHLADDRLLAADLIKQADMPVIGTWLDSIWLRSRANQKLKLDLPPVLPKAQRDLLRDATAQMKRDLLARDGHTCRFCGIPLVRAEVRKELRKYYDEVRWESARAPDQHRGLQVMWLQFDHVVVHSRGGPTTMDNLVVTCAACNFGRSEMTLEEVQVSDPRTTVRVPPTWDGCRTWDGLETILPESERYVQSPTSPFKPA